MIARPVDLLHFHGLTLTVAEAEQVRYVRLRPIADLLGLDWKRARQTASSEDNGELYGLQTLDLLPLDTFSGEIHLSKTAQYGAESPAETQVDGAFHMSPK